MAIVLIQLLWKSKIATLDHVHVLLMEELGPMASLKMMNADSGKKYLLSMTVKTIFFYFIHIFQNNKELKLKSYILNYLFSTIGCLIVS